MGEWGRGSRSEERKDYCLTKEDIEYRELCEDRSLLKCTALCDGTCRAAVKNICNLLGQLRRVGEGFVVDEEGMSGIPVRGVITCCLNTR